MVEPGKRKEPPPPPVDEEELERRRSRAEKWGTPEPLVMADSSSVPDVSKANADPVDFSLERRSDAVHICGTFVSKNGTREILRLFQEYSPEMVEWINLYACNVVFPDVGNCKVCLFYLSLFFSGDGGAGLDMHE